MIVICNHTVFLDFQMFLDSSALAFMVWCFT